MNDMTEQGIQFYVAGRYAEAEPHLQRAVELNPNIELNRYRLGVTLCELRRYAEAEPHLQRAVELNPKDDANHRWLRICRREMSQVRKTTERPVVVLQQPQREDPNSRILEQIQLGISLYQNNQFSEAIPLLKLGIDLNPRDEMNFYRLGHSFYKLHQYDMACPYLQRAVELEPNDESNQYLLGASLYNLNRFTEAEPYLQRAVKLNHTEENYCYLLGCCLYKLNRFTEAEPHLQRAVELKPDDNREEGSSNKDWLQQCSKSVSKELIKRFDKVTELVKIAATKWYEAGRFEEALPHLLRTIDIEPNNERNEYILGDCLYQLKRFSEAEPHLQRAVELNQSEENYCYLLGCCLSQLNRFSEAVPHLQRAVELKPVDNRDAGSTNKVWLQYCLEKLAISRPELVEPNPNVAQQINLGISLFQDSQYLEAIPYLRIAVNESPDDEMTQYRLGFSCYESTLYHEAAVHLQRAVDLKPDDETNQHFLGMCLYKQEKYAEAQPHLQRAVELESDDETNQYFLGMCFCRQEKYIEAQPHLQRAVELEPVDEDNRYILGVCFCRMEKYKEAEPHLQRAIDLKPNDNRGAGSTNRDWLNKCQSKLSHRVTVADIFEEALARNSGDSVAFGDLGVTRLYQNRFAEALALFREALRLSPADFYKIQIVECYERLGNTELAQQMRLEYPDLFEVITTEPNEELPTPPTFSEFLSSGATWLDGAGWENRQQSPLLKSLHQQGAKWSDPTKVLFPEYDIEEDDLAETLARAESLQQHLHLETEMPVYLQTEWVSIAMTIENGWIRAWVGIGLEGCAVSLNPNTWDLQFLNGDRDALFAAATVVNWYIDCSIMLTAHPKFRRESEDSRDDIRPWQISDNGWSATSLFSDDVDDIREGRQAAPPRAHRVRGHVRSLTQREPTDDARAKAPAHIRAFMESNDTWVQGHARGGQTETQNLLTRLHKHSSLADFLATAQLDSDYP